MWINKYYEVEEPDFKNEIVNLIQQQALKSLEIYQQVNLMSGKFSVTQLKSQLHHLSLLINFEKWLTVDLNSANPKLVEIRNQIQPSVNRVLKNSSTFSQLSATQRVYAKLNFANSLSQIPNQELRSLAIEYGQSALETAKSTTNQRIKSYSLGTLGKLQLEKSEVYFVKALSLAQSIQAQDIAYQWQQQLGNLYNKQGRAKEALKMYKSAIDNLAQIRDSILPSNNIDIQFFFQQEIEPVYRDYMKLLLKDSNPNLKEVIQINERLQTAQLENFLKCGKLDLIALNEITNLNSAYGIIHIIDLDDTIEVILQSSDSSLHHYSVEANLVKDNLSDLLWSLQDQKLATIDVQEIILPSQALYEKLIAPIASYLPASGTLIFILDKSFQSIPMGILHDGKNYLLDQYSIAATLGSRIRYPKPLSKKRFTALIAALSKPSPSLLDRNAPKGVRSLPKAKEEVKDVQSQTQSSLILLDEKGLDPEAAMQFLSAQGLVGQEKCCKELIETYRGNPVEMKAVVNRIHHFFASNTQRFLENKTTFISSRFQEMLNEMFGKVLSEFQQQVMIYIAEEETLNTVSIGFSELIIGLRQKYKSSVSTSELITALEILEKQSLIESAKNPVTKEISFALQPVIKKYIKKDPQGLVRASNASTKLLITS